MLLQKAKRICKAGTTVIVNRLNGDQWLGITGAIYPVFGGIELTESSVRTLFDVRSDDESFAVRTLSEEVFTDRGYSLEDVADEEHALATTSWTLEYKGRSFIPLTAAADTSTIAFVDADYLAPLKDCDELSLWLRFANNGTYVVAKSGFNFFRRLNVFDPACWAFNNVIFVFEPRKKTRDDAPDVVDGNRACAAFNFVLC